MKKGRERVSYSLRRGFIGRSPTTTFQIAKLLCGLRSLLGLEVRKSV